MHFYNYMQIFHIHTHMHGWSSYIPLSPPSPPPYDFLPYLAKISLRVRSMDGDVNSSLWCYLLSMDVWTSVSVYFDRYRFGYDIEYERIVWIWTPVKKAIRYNYLRVVFIFIHRLWFKLFSAFNSMNEICQRQLQN